VNQQILEQLEIITQEEQEILSGNEKIIRNIYLNEATNTIDKTKLLEYGDSIQIRKHTRFIHFPPHTHNYIEVVYMCKGTTRHLINGEEVILKEGELLFLNQNATQEIFPAAKEDIAINFIILPEFFEQSLKLLSNDENLVRQFMIDSLKAKDDKTNYLHFEVSNILPVQNLIENLIWTLLYNQPNKHSSNQITFGLLMIQLANYSNLIISGNKYEQKLILQVLAFIEEHYRDCELIKLATYLNVDMLWLSRTIKKETGSNFTDLVQQKRLNQAVFLLLNTRMILSIR
jgi:AraC-like DNA-binding protein/mannose-6-phosphate isomerase-like protein (cupin superfamily)